MTNTPAHPSTEPQEPRAEGTGNDPLRPADHVDSDGEIAPPALGFVGWLRWGWRQLTSMRTALVLLLLLAIAAIPGSMFPQRMADPNGVVKWKSDNPDLFPVADWFQLFDVYTSPWFSAIYLLLFVSLIGCIIPRTRHHLKALRAQPPRTPARLGRLDAYRSDEFEVPGDAAQQAEASVALAAAQLKSAGYRVQRFDGRGAYSVSAERGYLRETGNLLFHVALLGVLVSVGVGTLVSYTGQVAMIEGRTFVNQALDYNTMNKGRLVSDESLTPYAITLDSFDVTYFANGQAGDFSANLTVRAPEGDTSKQSVKVNYPLDLWGDRTFLLGNGYAPQVTVRNTAGEIVFREKVPFLPQDSMMTSLGVVKVPDGLQESGAAVQMGLIGFFYPTQAKLETGALTSQYPGLLAPMLTLDVYIGDLGIDDGTPRNVYTLSTDGMQQLTGRAVNKDSIRLTPGQTEDLPNGMGTVTFDNIGPQASGDYSKSVARFVSLSMHHDPTAPWVLGFAILTLASLFLALFVPRRRMWVKATAQDGNVTLEYAGLARGEDPQLRDAVAAFAEKHQTALASKVD